MSSSTPIEPPSPPSETPVFQPTNPSPNRLGVPFQFRLPLTSSVAFLSGLTLGGSHGSRNASFRYRAENAHRFPTTNTGWFLYHKSKNYHSNIGGVKDGIKMGWKLSLWSAGFFALEEVMDKARRGKRDFLSTVVAGLTTSGLYSLKGRQDMFTAARTAKTALVASLAFGLIQDVLYLARGHHLFYVDFVTRKIWVKKDGEALQVH